MNPGPDPVPPGPSRYFEPTLREIRECAVRLKRAAQIVREARTWIGPNPTPLDGAVYEVIRALDTAVRATE